MDGKPVDEKAYADARARRRCATPCASRSTSGLDVVNDGEMGKPSFITYAASRLDGLEKREGNAAEPVRQHARDAGLPGILPVGGGGAGQRAAAAAR